MSKRARHSHSDETNEQPPVVPIETLRQQRADAVAELKVRKSAGDADAILEQKLVVQGIDAQMEAATSNDVSE